MSGRDEGRRVGDESVDPTAALGERDEALASAVAAWRADVPVRAEWRDALLREVALAPAPRRLKALPAPRAGTRRAWLIPPWIGVAAALALVAAGVAIGFGVARRALPATGASRASDTIADVGRATAPDGTPSARTVASERGWPTRFAIVAPSARRVALVGDFNRWDPSRTPMRPLGDGRTWVLDVPLPAGRHVYAFVVDGELTADPSAPRAPDDDFGVPSSVVLVMGPG